MAEQHEWIDAQGKWSVYESPTGFYMRPHGAKVPMPAGKEILRLSAEVDRLKALTEWRPMSEEAKEFDEVLLLVGGARSIGHWGHSYGDGSPVGWCCDGLMCENPHDAYDIKGAQPTHWMPLPEPPKSAKALHEKENGNG